MITATQDQKKVEWRNVKCNNEVKPGFRPLRAEPNLNCITDTIGAY